MRRELKSDGATDYGASFPADRGPPLTRDDADRTRFRRNAPAGGKRSIRMMSTTPLGLPPIMLVGEREHRLYVLVPEDIDYIEAQDNYVKLHDGGVDYISRDSMKRLASVLKDRGFVRIGRSLLLNIRAIDYAQRTGRGRFLFTLSSGVSLQSGQRFRAEILRVLPFAQGMQKASAG